jgi:8-oxo-dGTP pyrophosphatase MutT (NUDIX family)
VNPALPHGRTPHALALARLRAYLARRQPRRLALEGFRQAAVAVLLSDREGVTHVTLTERSATLRAHSGQVSLPGGVRDPDDPSFVATALRECHEEIGVEPGWIRVLGMMDDELTSTSFIVTPVIAELSSTPRYAPNPAEVARIFEAPLAAFANREAARDLGQHSIGDLVYSMRAYRYRDHEVTGATARILERLSDVIGAAS